MKLKVQTSKTELAPEGMQIAILKEVKAKGETKCSLEFEVNAQGRTYIAAKDYPRKLDSGSPLLRDAETINGRKLVGEGADQEFDLDSLIGKACQVVVQHRRGSGGRMVAAVDSVLPAIAQIAKSS